MSQQAPQRLMFAQVHKRLQAAVLPILLVGALVSDAAFTEDFHTTKRMQVAARGDFIKACPPGHRLEFVLGSNSLFIDPHWLHVASLAELSQRFGSDCPSQPVPISSLYFSNSILNIAKIPDELGQPFLFFTVIDEATLPRTRMTKLYLPEAPPLRQTAEPYVEDITRISFRVGGASPSARVYRLVYPGSDSEPPTSINISCGGVPGRLRGRTCFTPILYRYRQGLSVKYEFQQNRLPLAEPGQLTPSDTMREPEGALIFDMRMRAWIEGLSNKP